MYRPADNTRDRSARSNAVKVCYVHYTPAVTSCRTMRELRCARIQLQLCTPKRKTLSRQKVNFAVEQVTKIQRGGVEVYLYKFFTLVARWGWVVNDTIRPLYPRECPGIHNVEGWVGPRDDVDVWEKEARLPPEFDPRQSSHERVANRLRFPADNILMYRWSKEDECLVQFPCEEPVNVSRCVCWETKRWDKIVEDKWGGGGGVYSEKRNSTAVSDYTHTRSTKISVWTQQ